MNIAKKGTNVKLTKLFYKYADKHQKIEAKERGIKQPIEDEEAPYPPYNFSWLVENKIAGMGCPQSVANLNFLADVGINHLITLSPEKIPPILECTRKLKWTEIRIKEFGAPTLRQIIKFIEICERAEINGEIIGVHCRHGRGRTGTMLACYLVKFNNMAPERAVLTVRVQRPAPSRKRTCVRGVEGRATANYSNEAKSQATWELKSKTVPNPFDITKQ